MFRHTRQAAGCLRPEGDALGDVGVANWVVEVGHRTGCTGETWKAAHVRSGVNEMVQEAEPRAATEQHCKSTATAAAHKWQAPLP